MFRTPVYMIHVYTEIYRRLEKTLQITKVKFIVNTEKLNPGETMWLTCQTFISYFPVWSSTDDLYVSPSLTACLELKKKFYYLFVVVFDGDGSGGGGDVLLIFVVREKSLKLRDIEVIYLSIE